jgi:hypothetical protein
MKKTVFLFILLISLGTKAQNTLFFLEGLPQNINFNPAYTPAQKFFICLPGLGGINIRGYNTGFNYKEFDNFYDNLGSEGYNPENFVGSIGEYNKFFAESRINMFSLGFKLKSEDYLSFFSNIHNLITVKAESDLVYLLSNYDDLPAENFPIIVDDLNLTTNNYFTIGFSYSRKINQNLTLGISPRINSNIVGIKTNQISYRVDRNDPNNTETDLYDESFTGEALIGLPVEINENAISGDELDLNEGIFPENWENNLKPSNLFNNIRLGLDLGATYSLNDWFFSASILNIGASGWKTNGYLLRGNDESIKIKENEKIKIGIPVKMYLGAKRQFSQNWNYGVILNNTFYNTGLNSSATISLNGYISKMLSTSISYTAGYKFDNLGAALRLRFLPGTDLFVATDNLIQLMNYRNAYCFSAALGLNIAVGKPDKTTP